MILHDNIHVLRAKEDLYYYDSRSVQLPAAISPLAAWNLMVEGAHPFLRGAFWVRDTISSCFGVKRIGGFSPVQRHAIKAGDHLDFFLVEHEAPDVLVLTERDRHLDVMTCISTRELRLTITSSVVVHNWFGRVYMLPVGPAHKLIVNAMLRRVRRSLEAKR